ncbi:MAG: uracil-DNA glycosylase [Alphaproteobacteria bacterium]|jgi:DNA polymerase|nr:uracil-DNA glycosylase [Alphaproteobacteria bacterium]
MSSKKEQLEILKQEAEKCRDCELGGLRNKLVFSDGNSDARIVLIGEAPGAEEDKTGFPFVGRAGKLLDEFLNSVGITRENDIYIMNTLKCRPPQNRDPLPSEKVACRKFFDKQLDIIKPDIILLCGAVAMKSLMEGKLAISKVRGQWFDGPGGAKMMPIFHPSYLLRNHRVVEGSPRWLMFEDMKEIKRVYDGVE